MRIKGCAAASSCVDYWQLWLVRGNGGQERLAQQCDENQHSTTLCDTMMTTQQEKPAHGQQQRDA